MAVAIELQLPDQPASGSVVLQPLGGDGWVSPQSVFRVQVNSVSDASGGGNAIHVRGDLRYVQVISSVLVTLLSGADTLDLNVRILDESGVGSANLRTVVPLTAVSGSGPTNSVSWTPEPLLFSATAGALGTPPGIAIKCDNTDTETLGVIFSIYNFRKTAREKVPIDKMLAFLTRSTSVVL